MNDILKNLFPLLGTAIAGPAGAALGSVAAGFIADKLGLESKTVEAVQEVLTSGKLSSEDITKLKLAEIEFKKWMDDNGIKREQLEVQNIQGARDMYVATGALTPSIMTWMITLGFFAVLGAMFMYPEVKESAPLMIMLGALGAEFSSVCKFWFGSNSGSARTKELLAQASLK